MIKCKKKKYRKITSPSLFEKKSEEMKGTGRKRKGRGEGAEVREKKSFFTGTPKSKMMGNFKSIEEN